MKLVPCPLFQAGEFVLHSGGRTRFRIECDALNDDDWSSLAAWAAQQLPPFGAVEGVPRGGVKLATALSPYVTTGPLLIVDDVLSTGACMEKWRAERHAMGLVVFARGVPPRWVRALFSVPEAVSVAPLVDYMNASDRKARSAAFLRTYAARIRNKTETTWETPNTRAQTLEDIATLLEQHATASPRAQETT